MGVKRSNSWRPFAADPELILLIDRMARRYSVLPSELLRLPAWDLNVCRLAYSEGIAEDMDRAQALGRQGAMFSVNMPGMG